jgi:hypothetical protein
MTVKFTSPGSMAQITMAAALQTLAIDLVALSSSAESNDDSTERMFFRNFTVKLGTMGGARVLADPVSLVIVPLLGSVTGDTTAAGLGAPYIATDKHGNKLTWTLDAAVTARNLTWANICIPNGDYYVGVLNGCTAQAFAGTNEVWASSAFSVENVT